MAWTHVPADDVNGEYWIDHSDPAYPLMTRTNPALGFADKNAALESLYMPVAGGNMAQMQSLIAANPQKYAQFGITPDNAASMVDSTFYDRLHNVANDDWIDAIGKGALGALYGAAIGDFTGLLNVDGMMNSAFGDAISSTTASGVNPTQVAGTSFTEGVTPGLDLGANNLWSGSYTGPEMTSLADMAAGQGLGLPATGAGLPMLPGGGSLASGGSTAGGGAASAAAGTVGGGSATAGAGSALSRILDGSATSADWLSLAGTGGSTLLGMLGSQQQTQAYKDLAKQYMDFGAPSRARFEASMSPGFDVNSIPGYKGAVDTASETLLRRLSATGGNPFGNPGGLIEANKAIISGTALPAYNEYARLNANTGFGSSMNAAVPLQTAAIGSDANSLNALGYGLGQLTQPPKQDLASLLKQYQGFGGLSLT